MHTDSPLRYPGGKFSLRFLVKDYLDNNGPIANFIEPFAGGAGLSLWLLFNGYVKQVYINDYDVLIYRIWDSILNDTENFLDKLSKCPVTLDEWRKQKALIDDEIGYGNKSPLDIAFAAFFLNRCNRSGIITRVAGPIGGKDQKGEWKLDARFNKNTLITKISKIAQRRDDIHISNYDAITFLRKLTVSPFDSFIYLDPPYYVIGKELYRSYYNDNDHLRLRDFITSKSDIKWLISYDNHKFIRDLYTDQVITEISINHQAHIQHPGSELLITSKEMVTHWSKDE